MKRFDQINVIPFIDIMLVLLAIVLTTASFISQGIIDIDLPEAQSAQPADDRVNLKLAISASGGYFLDEREISLEALEAEFKGLDKSTAFALHVDKATRFEHFVAIIDLLRKEELENLSIVTQQGT